MKIKEIKLDKAVPLYEIEEGGLFTYKQGHVFAGRLHQKLAIYTSYVDKVGLIRDCRVMVSEVARGILWYGDKDARVHKVKQLNELEVEI